MRRKLRALRCAATWGLAASLGLASLAVAAAVVVGYRPVIISGASMGDAAPLGSLVVARPTTAVEVDDLLVMQRRGRTPVTHRVIEIEHHGTQRYAITKGDANTSPDLEPYRLDGDDLVGIHVIPGLGAAAETAASPEVLFIAAVATVSMLAFVALRDIWLPESAPDPRPVAQASARAARRRRGRRTAALGVVVVTTLGGAAAWAWFGSSEIVAANTISTADCYDARVGSVQRGQVVNAADGVHDIAITPVDPTSSFLHVSVRSAGAEPADAMVRARLVSGTTVELLRRTDAISPPPVTVDWAVVEYACGVSVQRGITDGNGAATLDVPISAVSTSESFVTVSSVGDAGETAFDGTHQVIAELAGADLLRLRSPALLPVTHSHAWQVVTFDDPADAEVITVSATLTGPTTQADIAIPAVDPHSTIVLASATSTGTGLVGDQAVRVHLESASNVRVDRAHTGDDVQVAVQVVSLVDGTTVHHGTVDLATGVPAVAIDIPPVDAARTTTLGTVSTPGALSGGSTTAAAGGAIGEASATVSLVDPKTVSVTRSVTSADSSFGWQAVTWGGPSWADPGSPFRQRIDVAAGAVATPGGYSVPVLLDHAALVADGFSLASGDDLRIHHWDGSSWTELDRVLDDQSAWGDPATTMWFRTTAAIDAATTDSYWLYFGDPTPDPPLDDPENVWLLVEDFESGTLGDFEDRTAGTAWYAADPWTRRITLTVRAGEVASDLVDFPLLVTMTEPTLGTVAQPDGSDIRFTASDGTTRLDHEIESFDAGTGELTAWVRVPVLTAATDTVIHLDYGASNAPDQQATRTTWNASTLATWHLAGDLDTAPALDDSTAANHDGLAFGGLGAASSTAGRVGPGVVLDGLDDRFDAEPVSLDVSQLTVSGWVEVDTFADANPRLIAHADDHSSVTFELYVDDLGPTTGAAVARFTVDGTIVTVSGGTVTVGTWHHLAATWDGATVRLYLDGAQVASAPALGAIATEPGRPLTIGDLATGLATLHGTVDEIRIETTARSAAWLAAHVDNVENPSTFAWAGPVQTGVWHALGPWTVRKPLVVRADAVTGTHVDYPLFVSVTDTDLASLARADGADLVFTAADGTTRLDHTVEHFDSGTGALEAWVRVPTVSSSADTELFVYFGNSGAADQSDAEAVFGPGADLVAQLAGT